MKNEKLIMGMVIGGAVTAVIMHLMNRNEAKSQFGGRRMMARPMGGGSVTALKDTCKCTSQSGKTYYGTLRNGRCLCPKQANIEETGVGSNF